MSSTQVKGRFPVGSYAFVDRFGDTLQLTEEMAKDYLFGWRLYAYVANKDYWAMRPVFLDELPPGEVRELGKALLAERNGR